MVEFEVPTLGRFVQQEKNRRNRDNPSVVFSVNISKWRFDQKEALESAARKMGYDWETTDTGDGGSAKLLTVTAYGPQSTQDRPAFFAEWAKRRENIEVIERAREKSALIQGLVNNRSSH